MERWLVSVVVSMPAVPAVVRGAAEENLPVDDAGVVKRDVDLVAELAAPASVVQTGSTVVCTVVVADVGALLRLGDTFRADDVLPA